MKNVLIPLLAASCVAAAAAPAFAAPQNINERQANVEWRIDQGVRDGSLTRNEAMRLHMQVRDISRLEARYRSNGLSRWERADLQRRLDAVSASIRHDRHDGDRRYGDHRYGDRR